MFAVFGVFGRRLVCVVLHLGLRLLGRVALCFRVYCLVFDLRFNLAVLVGWCVYVWDLCGWVDCVVNSVACLNYI